MLNKVASKSESLKKRKPIWIGVQGGTCAGKTTLSNELSVSLGCEKTLVICLDSFFKPYDRKANASKITAHNFDHPSSLDWVGLKRAVKSLNSGSPVLIPEFEYESGFTLEGKEAVPRKYIVLEGLWPYFDSTLFKLFDIKVYVDTPADIRLARLISRVGGNRGWTTYQAALEYYLQCARPMQSKYIDRGRYFADMFVNGDSPFKPAIKRVIKSIALLVEQ